MKTSIKQFYLITVYVEKWITENYDRLMGLPAYQPNIEGLCNFSHHVWVESEPTVTMAVIIRARIMHKRGS